MDLNSLKIKLKTAERLQKPGQKSHLKLAPISRIKNLLDLTPENAVKSAVLLLLYPQNGNVFLPFIKRSVDNSVHSGQIAFPGGKYEESDINHYNTATREAFEETGILPQDVELLADLSPLFVPVSNYLIMPVVGIAKFRPQFVKNFKEVDEIFEISIKELLNLEISQKNIDVRGTSFDVPAFIYKEYTIWGATAMILSEFIDILKLEN